MKTKLFFATLLIALSGPAYAQKESPKIEITPYVRFDKYPEINNRKPDELAINGTSLGINGTYKFPVLRHTFLKVGAGYYRYGFDKLRNKNNFGEGDTRNINYPSDLKILFYTDKYWYNTLLLTVGAERTFPLGKGLQFNAGVNLNNYYTYSQHYHIDWAQNAEQYGIETDYTVRNGRYFGFSASLQAGLQKDFGKFSVGPQLIIPVFDLWKQDGVFPGEDNDSKRSKWSQGIGAGVTVGYAL
ncbi:hypothetical protein [Chitinophaga sp. YIM B06452]|uniref:hypothetical protein n=1 Tax=Chitinophaga sp. YIM B06452 TaxID=3082158 RepID=UPI0031FE5A51